MTATTHSLFLKFWELEAQTKTSKQIIDDVNAACGTKFQSNWKTKMLASGCSMERIGLGLRRHMMTRVLKDEMIRRGTFVSDEDISVLVELLT